MTDKTISLDKYRRTAVLLQDLAAKFNHVSIPLPKFVLVGIQSSGKTRLLSVFAKFKVGGAEKAGIGTRCPVIYTFRMTNEATTRCRLGESLEALDPVNIENVHTSVANHMAQLGKTTTGFSDKPFYVELDGNLTLNAVIIDLPGLQPISPETEATNRKIAGMIETYVSDPRAIPLVMCGYREPDITFVRSDMSQIWRCFKNDRSKAKDAILLASKVDTVLLQLNSKLLESYAALAQEYGFDPSKIVFLSLAPEIIGGETFLINEEKTPFTDQTRYYSSKIFEQEDIYLKDALKRVAIDPGKYKFGIRIVVDLVDVTLLNALRNNFNLARQAMHKLGQDLTRRMPHSDAYDLQQLCVDYAACIFEILSNSGGQVDHNRITRVLTNVAGKYPAMVDTEGVQSFAKELEHELSRSFDEERQLNYNEQPQFTDFKSAKRAFPPELLSQLNAPSLGSPAMHRLLSLFGLNLMTCKLARFEVAELRRMTGFQPGCVITSEVIGKMVCRMKGDVYNETVKLIKWNIWLFETQVDAVITLLRAKLQLLGQFPALRGKIEEQVKNEYFHQFAALQGQVTTDAARMFDLRFSPPIASHEISGVIHLLSTAKLTRTTDAALTPRAVEDNDRQPVERNESERIEDRFKRREKAAETLLEQIKNGRNLDRHADYLQDFFAAIASARDALVFAEMPHQTWRENRIMDLEDARKVDELNAAAQMIARYHLGQFYYDLVRLLYVRVAFEFGEQKLHRRVEQQVKTFINKLFGDAAALKKLKQVNAEQVKVLQNLEREMSSYLLAAEAFNECCRENACVALNTKQVADDVARLRKTIQAEVAALQDADDENGVEEVGGAEDPIDPNLPSERERQLRNEIEILLERIHGTESLPRRAELISQQMKAHYEAQNEALKKEIEALIKENEALNQQLHNIVRGTNNTSRPNVPPPLPPPPRK